jgi:hypothetical protein
MKGLLCLRETRSIPLETLSNSRSGNRDCNQHAPAGAGGCHEQKDRVPSPASVGVRPARDRLKVARRAPSRRHHRPAGIARLGEPADLAAPRGDVHGSRGDRRSERGDSASRAGQGTRHGGSRDAAHRGDQRRRRSRVVSRPREGPAGPHALPSAARTAAAEDRARRAAGLLPSLGFATAVAARSAMSEPRGTAEIQ